ncbi:MAG: hypothetical protein ABSB95_12840 [Dissulfurispiraceae bacterium]
MIFINDFDDGLRNLAREFLVFDIKYVPDMLSWAEQNNIPLSEPGQPMKLTTGSDHILVMIVQEKISDELLDGIINGLGVRWTVRDVATDISKRLNSIEKQLAYYFLKEYARTKQDLAGDELLEDEWAIDQMEKLGFFRV